tara:strand:- start:62 stop:397 length:336 start_codon:yes stop_codon:yes gene_type:complete
MNVWEEYCAADGRARFAAFNYLKECAAHIRDCIEEEEVRGEDAEDALWEAVGNAECIIYTYRAGAIVRGWEYDNDRTALEAQFEEYGAAEEAPSIEALAHYCLMDILRRPT